MTEAPGWWPPLAVVGALGMVALLGTVTGHPLLVTSFSSSAVLMFTAPQSPAAAPRVLLVGQMLSGVAGLLVGGLVGGPEAVTFPLTAGLACALMLLSGSMHPPATTTALVAAFTHPGIGFLVVPLLAGTLCLAACAAVVRGGRPFARSSGPHAEQAVVARDRLGAIRHVELAQEPVHVELHGPG